MRAFRSGWMRVATRLVATGSSSDPGSRGRTVIVWLVGATDAPFQASNVRVTVTVPAAASATRTGPWKLTPQHRSLISHFSLSGGAPGLAGGRETSAAGLAAAGTVPS
jgi:hypothetical protein